MLHFSIQKDFNFYVNKYAFSFLHFVLVRTSPLKNDTESIPHFFLMVLLWLLFSLVKNFKIQKNSENIKHPLNHHSKMNKPFVKILTLC